MTKQFIYERVRAIASEVAGENIDTIFEVSNLVNDLGMDSLDTSELAIKLEIEFNFSIHAGLEDEWETIEDVCKYIEKRFGVTE